MEDLKKFYFLFVLLGAFCAVVSEDEPVCPSFEYKDQLLESFTRLELTIASMKEGIMQTLELRERALNESQDNLEKKKHENVLPMRISLSPAEEQDEKNDSKTAFTAHLDHKEGFGAAEILIFNKVLYNHNNGYDAKTGIFTAPINGTYMFSFQIEHWSAKEFSVDLKVDNIIHASAVLTSKGSTMSGNTVVLGLNEGQSVWIQALTSGELFGSDTFLGTTFSGAFLY